MTDITLQDISKEGEKYVIDYLKGNSFKNITMDMWQHSINDIKADSWAENILVQVKTSMFPNEPPDISRDDRIKIISRAITIKRNPYVAYVKIERDNKLLKSIRWEKLS